MTKYIIPIYKAKRLDNNEYVEGLYFNDAEGHWIVNEYTMSVEENCEKIDPSTLFISFDNGTHWRTIQQVVNNWL